MRCLRWIGAIMLVVAISSATAAQLSLTTTLAAGNGQSGNMFDIEATGGAPLKIQSFDIHTASTGITVEVWVVTAGTTYLGNEAIPTNWTMLALVPNVNGLGNGVPTPLNLTLNHSLPTGVRRGFYVTATSGTLNYTNGTFAGAPFASNSELTFYEGIGVQYPFSTTFSPRVFNGVIRYGFDQNLLSISQSGPGIGNLVVTMSLLSPTAGEGWTLLSADTSLPINQGFMFGLNPDSTTWRIFGIPYFPGNPFHFNAADAGVFPSVPFSVPPGSVSSLFGMTFDFAAVMLNTSGQYDSKSNVVRFMFQ